MADFRKAYFTTLGHEGGYANDPQDRGGETYRGISRRFYPKWEGWAIIDKAKGDKDKFPQNIDHSALYTLVQEFYEDEYWNKFRGDDILNQELANELFDSAVNLGLSRAVRLLQQSLNLLNREGRLYSNIDEDGEYGTKTHETLLAYLRTEPPSLLYKVLNILQGAHYIQVMRNSESQEKFARGWLKRVDFIK